MSFDADYAEQLREKRIQDIENLSEEESYAELLDYEWFTQQMDFLDYVNEEPF